MNKKYKIVALFGKSCAGKDTIQKYIVSSMPYLVNSIISCTTRPKRDYEKDGIDYHFLSDKHFGDKIMNGSMLEATAFRGWFYGTPVESLKENFINIGVFNIEGIECLLSDPRLEVFPIYIKASDKVRLKRSLLREKNPDVEEIIRRYKTDKKDFSNINFKYKVFRNNKNKIRPYDMEIIEKYIVDFYLEK